MDETDETADGIQPALTGAIAACVTCSPLKPERLMSVKEVSKALKVSERVIQRHAADMGLTENGKRTELTEEQATEIKNRIAASGRNDLANVCEVKQALTEVDIEEMTLTVINYHLGEIARLKAENAELAPKAAFFDQVANSKTAISMRDCAAALNIPGWGRNKLFSFLREKGILDGNNMPYREFQDRGYFRVIEQSWAAAGSAHVSFRTLVYQRGVEYIRKLVSAEIAA